MQIPDRAYAVGPGWQELLARLYQQLCGLAADYALTGLKEKLGGLRCRFCDGLNYTPDPPWTES